MSCWKGNGQTTLTHGAVQLQFSRLAKLITMQGEQHPSIQGSQLKLLITIKELMVNWKAHETLAPAVSTERVCECMSMRLPLGPFPAILSSLLTLVPPTMAKSEQGH